MARLPELSPEDLEKVQRLKGNTGNIVIDRELYLEAEFGYYFGWPGILAIENDEISLSKVQEILQAMRKVHSDKMLEQAKFDFYASKDSKNFNIGIGKVTNKARVD
jgi:hypothetical protein